MDAFAHAIRMAREVGLSDTGSETQRGLSLARLGRRCEAEAAAASAERDPPHVPLEDLYLALDQPDQARTPWPAISGPGPTARTGATTGTCSAAAPCCKRLVNRSRNCSRSTPPRSGRSNTRPTSAACSLRMHRSSDEAARHHAPVT